VTLTLDGGTTVTVPPRGEVRAPGKHYLGSGKEDYPLRTALGEPLGFFHSDEADGSMTLGSSGAATLTIDKSHVEYTATVSPRFRRKS
jgi:hypothetical protein